jgi:hypothetical protein
VDGPEIQSGYFKVLHMHDDFTPDRNDEVPWFQLMVWLIIIILSYCTDIHFYIVATRSKYRSYAMGLINFNGKQFSVGQIMVYSFETFFKKWYLNQMTVLFSPNAQHC